MFKSLKTAAAEIITVGQRLEARGLAPATSGNYSARLEDRIAITVSGRHKGRLGKNYIMSVDLSGAPLENKKPSAETLLHAQIYRLYPNAGAILHTHSASGVALTRFFAADQNLILEGYEILKAFPGVTT